MAVITATELGNALRETVDSSSAALAIAAGVGAVEALTGPLESRTSTVVLPFDDACIDLPASPVTAVSSVKVDGTAATYEWLRPTSEVRLIGWTLNPLPSRWHTVEVTFVHGYGVVPPLAKAIALEVAKRAYRNSSGLRSVQVGAYREDYADASPVALTDLEVAQLERAGLIANAYVTGDD